MRPHKHVWHRGASHEEGAVDVRINHHLPGIRIGFPETGGFGQEVLADILHAPSGIVHKNVQTLPMPQCLGHHLLTVA